MPTLSRTILFFLGIILQIVAGWHYSGVYASIAIVGFYLSLVLLIDGITRLPILARQSDTSDDNRLQPPPNVNILGGTPLNKAVIQAVQAATYMKRPVELICGEKETIVKPGENADDVEKRMLL